jgi:hypothetical protein
MHYGGHTLLYFEPSVEFARVSGCLYLRRCYPDLEPGHILGLRSHHSVESSSCHKGAHVRWKVGIRIEEGRPAEG